MASEIKFLLSNLSLPPRMQAFAGAEACAEYAEAVGADGYEITPTTLGPFGQTALTRELVLAGQSTKAWEAEKNAPGSNAPETSDTPDTPDESKVADATGAAEGTPQTPKMYGDLVHALHASPRLGNEPGTNLLRRAVYPLYQESLDNLLDIQRATGHELNAVLFPGYVHTEASGASSRDGFGARLIKPRAIGMLCTRHRQKNPSLNKLHEIMGIEGVDGIAWDTFDAMAEAEFEKNAESATLSFYKLLTGGLIHAVHLSLGRRDYASRSNKLTWHTMAAKKAFITGSRSATETKEAKFLVEAARSWNQADDNTPRTVTLQTYPSFHLSTKQIMAEQRAIIASSRELVAA